MKLWGGRFEEGTDKEVETFSASMSVDHRLWFVDIQASMAHARMLGQVGVLSAADTQQIIQGLKSLCDEIQSGKVILNPAAEDIHSEIESKLTEKIGAVAGKLHTARSRNDQVATDLRLYMMGESASLLTELRALQSCIVEIASQHTQTLLPGLTHLQHAQPVSLAHHLLAYFWMLERDEGRLQDSLKRLRVLPLGSAALAGTGFPLDRAAVAKELGFLKASENSMDAVSDRDFVVEFLSSGSLIMIHLSRLCEELIIWSSPEFKFVEMSDRVTTGSSIMPQKKNPDVAELIRGKSAKLVAALTGAMVLLKGLPLSYNRDLQEDKEYIFSGLDTVRSSLRLMLIMLKNTKWNADQMKKSLRGDFSNATDLADDLVRKGLTFRQAHEVVGKIVSDCLKNGKILEELTLPELQKFSPVFDSSSLGVLPHAAVMDARTTEGGTSPSSVRKQIELAKAHLAKPLT
jgi:argininosuccinate lyase